MERLKPFWDQLPWRGLVGPGVIRNDDASLQMSCQLDGPDLSGQAQEVKGARMLQANNAIRRMGRGEAIFTEARRFDVTSDVYPAMVFSHPVAQQADDERRASFLAPGQHLLSEFFLTYRYQPPTRTSSWLESYFLEGESPIEEVSADASVMTFRQRAVHFASLLGGRKRFVPLTDGQSLTYLHSTCSWKRHLVKVPPVPLYLNVQLADCMLDGGYDLKLGPLYLQIVEIIDLPDLSVAGLLDGLNELGIEFRWCARYISVPKPRARAIMRQIQSQHHGQRLRMIDRISSMVGGGGSAVQDDDALNKAQAVSDARQEIGADLTGYGYFTDVVVVWDRSARRALEKAQVVEEMINDRECVARIADSNAEDAWYGSHPGNVKHNLRRLMESSLNRVHRMPGLMQVWTGTPWNRHLQAPALIHATTAEHTPFHVSTHAGQSDVGNIAVIGSMGKGKTLLLNLMRLMWTKYPRARGVAFDFKRGMRPTTLCLGGTYIDLGTAGPSFQPLGNLETRAGYDRAHSWIGDRLLEAHMPLTAERLSYMRVGLQALQALSRRHRTISRLIEEWKIFTGEMLRPSVSTIRLRTNDAELRRRMDGHQEIWNVFEGFRGGILDGDHDGTIDAIEQCYEWETLMESPRFVAPILSHVWPQIEDSFQGDPTLFRIDELKRLMVHPLVIDRIDKGIRLYRFRNVSFIVSTQFVEDVLDPALASMFEQSFPTKIILPNPSAMTEVCREAYRKIGITEEQLPLIAAAEEKSEYFLLSDEGSRLFRCRLDGTALQVCGRASLADQRQMDRLLATPSEQPFWQRWVGLQDEGGDVDEDHAGDDFHRSHDYAVR